MNGPIVHKLCVGKKINILKMNFMFFFTPHLRLFLLLFFTLPVYYLGEGFKAYLGIFLELI